MKVAAITIGELAKETGAGIETIRYYERRNLLSPAGRKPSGYRFYDRTSVQKIRFIKNAKRLGFTLEEISELLQLKVKGRGRCGSVKSRAEVKLAEIKEKIANLDSMKKVLEELITHCRNDAPTQDCPILNSLQTGTDNKEVKNGKT